MNQKNERNYDSVRQTSFKSQPGVVSFQSTKEQEIADYLSNNEDYELNGANDIENLIEQKGNLKVTNKGSSINIRTKSVTKSVTKSAVKRPKAVQKGNQETMAEKQQRLFAWHKRKRVPHVPQYNPRSSLLSDDRIQHLEILAAQRAGIVDTKFVSKSYQDELSYI